MGTKQSLPTATSSHPSPPHSSASPRDLTGQITLYKNNPVACGGFADVLRGTWKRGAVEIEVAIKALRLYSITDEQKKEKIMKRLHRELKIWKRCEHENILPFFGVASGYGPWQSMVCQWMEHGNINDYLERFNFSLHIVDRLCLMRDVLAGLAYLHSLSIVHGDLTGANVLVDGSSKARLSDFGLSQVISEVEGSLYFTSTVSGAYRWTAPELYGYDDDDVVATSMPCDMYSYGSVVLQILSGKVPYYYLKKEVTVLLYVKDGRKPQRPTEITTEAYWDLIGRCWAEAVERPTAGSLFQDVKRLLSEAEQVRQHEEEQNKREREEQRRKEELEQKLREDEKRIRDVVPLRLSSENSSVVKGFRPRVGKALNPASSTAITRLSIPSSLSPTTQGVEPKQKLGKEVSKNTDQGVGKKIDAQRRKGSGAPSPPNASVGKVGFRSRVGRAMRSSSFSSISRPHSPSLPSSRAQDVNQSPTGARLSSKFEGKQVRKDQGDQGRQIADMRAKHIDSLRLSPPSTTGFRGIRTRMGNAVRRSSSFTTSSRPRTPSPNSMFAEDDEFPRISPTTASGFRGLRSRVDGVLRKTSISSLRSPNPQRSTPSPCPSIGQEFADYLFEASAICEPYEAETREEEQAIIDSSHMSSPGLNGTKGFRSRVKRIIRKSSNISTVSRARTSSVTSSLHSPGWK